ncbi:MAG: glucosamine-6-phosphate deaminase [Lentisphaerae bacterium ADurb.BinA184]|nr:MAG: glucosamine-6-phosphate deaminase [Lentisphaerae bacterium ADurb.BinA184]
MSTFRFQPAAFIPFRDTAAIARVRRIRRADITRHPNPDFRIRVIPDADVERLWVRDMFTRIRESAEAGRRMVMIMPNPWPSYRKVAALINRHGVSCRHLHTFNMDEYADQDGHIAPVSWELGFGHAFMEFFVAAIEPKLRPPTRQIHLLSDRTLPDYGRRLADLGGADICYSGPGWTGHLAFIEPDAPEFAAASLEEWKTFGPRVCTLSPFTIAQNSLHGCFGASGDLCAVPPKAATIGPAEVIAAKHRLDLHSIAVGGTFHSWQRLTTRLVLHGPVTPRVPESILQTLRTDVWVSENAAADIETRWDLGY